MTVEALVSMAKRVHKRLSKSGRVSREPSHVKIDPRQLELLVAQIRGEAKTYKTFKQVADAWLKANSARLVAPENEWRHIRHLKALWEVVEPELTPRLVGAVLGALDKLSGATKNKVRSTGGRIVTDAQRNGEWGDRNPFDLTARFQEVKTKRLRLTMDELLLTLPWLRPDRRVESKTAVMTGIRPGELLGLKKRQVDLAARKIVISRSHHRDSTKTGVSREIPIPEALVEDLREAMAKSPSEYVFPRPDGTGRRQRRDTKLARTLRTAMGKAGVVSHYSFSCRRKGCGFKEARPEQKPAKCPRCNFKLWIQPVAKKVVFYGLRHSAASLHREAGADPMAIKLTLGHAARDVTDDVYTHLTEETVRREMNKLKLENKMLDSETVDPELGKLVLYQLSYHRVLRPVVQSETLLTVKDVAARLNVKIRSIYGLVERKELHAVRIGSLYRFHPEDVEAYLARGRS